LDPYILECRRGRTRDWRRIAAWRVVARELGLPCVAGIEGVITAIKDVQLIEVGGSLGSMRLL